MKKMSAKNLISFMSEQWLQIELSENAGFLRVHSNVKWPPSVVFVDLIRLHKPELMEFLQS